MFVFLLHFFILVWVNKSSNKCFHPSAKHLLLIRNTNFAGHSVGIKQSVISAAFKTALKTRMGICINKTLLLDRPDDYWFHIKLSPTFYNKIAPMVGTMDLLCFHHKMHSACKALMNVQFVLLSCLNQCNSNASSFLKYYSSRTILFCFNKISGLRMRIVTWNSFPIKKFGAVRFDFVAFVETSYYLKTYTCKAESSLGRAQSTDSRKAYSKPRAFNCLWVMMSNSLENS